MPRTSEPALGSVMARQSWRAPLMVGSKYSSICAPWQARKILLGRATSICKP